MSTAAGTRGGAFPFFQGATNSQEVMSKTHKLIYGKRRLERHIPANQAVEKPDVESLLLHSPNNKIDSIIRNARLANEIDGMTVSNVLKRLRKHNRYDKGLQICRSYEKEVGRRLKASHFVSLMTLALHSPEKLEDGGPAPNGGWREALRLFNAGFILRKKENPLTSASVGAAFAALGAAGKWEQSTQLFNSVVKDRIKLEPKSVHTLLSQLRRQDKWDLALKAFDTSVQLSHTQPDYLMYRQLLYTIQDSAKLSPTNAATAWRYALSVASAIDHVCPPNAGTYNILIETCAISTSRLAKKLVYDGKSKKFYRVSEGRTFSHKDEDPEDGIMNNHKLVDVNNHWEQGIRVFQHLQDRVVLSAVTEGSSRTIVNSQTIEALSKLRQKNPEFQIKCIDLARKHGLPIPESVFRRLFVSLDLRERSEEGLAFAQKFIEDSVNDTGNLGSALEPMLAGLLDSLSLHPDSEIALITANHFKHALQPVVSSATVGCAIWGDESQSWIVESKAKVAVIDATTLKQATATPFHLTLLSQFDAIMVPFTAVRAVLKSLQDESNHSPRAEKYLKALDLLRALQVLEAPLRQGEENERAGAGPVQVLPFIHHLKSLNYLSSLNFQQRQQQPSMSSSSESTSSQPKLDPSLFEEDEDVEFIETETERRKFLSAAAGNNESLKIVSLEDDDNDKNIFNKSKKDSNKKNALAVPFWDLQALDRNKNATAETDDTRHHQHFLAPSVYGWSHPVATALMLSRLNPDATITVVHTSSHVKKCAQFYGVKNRYYFDLYTEFVKEREMMKKNKEREEEQLMLGEMDEDDEGSAIHNIGEELEAEPKSNMKRKQVDENSQIRTENVRKSTGATAATSPLKKKSKKKKQQQ